MRRPIRRLLWVMVGRSLGASNPVRALAGRVGGVLSMAIGVISIILGLIPCINVLAVLFSIIGIAIGMVAYRQSRLAHSTRSYAVLGLIFSGIALLVSTGISRSLYDQYYNHQEKVPTEQNDRAKDYW